LVDNYHLLSLSAGEKQGNEPTDERNPEEDVDDDNGTLITPIPGFTGTYLNSRLKYSTILRRLVCRGEPLQTKPADL
jgi:hypothetical protein